MGVMVVMIIVGMLILLGLAALRWGVDTTGGPDTPEWERRRTWRASVPDDAKVHSRAIACDAAGGASDAARRPRGLTPSSVRPATRIAEFLQAELGPEKGTNSRRRKECSMVAPEIRALVAREQYRDILAAVEHERLVAIGRASRPSIITRFTQSIGRLLVRVGLALLEYGLDGRLGTLRHQPPPASSSRYN